MLRSAYVISACLVGASLYSIAQVQAAGFDCSKFEKNADGSWRVVQALEIYGPNGRIDFTPNETYAEGQQKNGLDMAKLLDANCSKK